MQEKPILLSYLSTALEVTEGVVVISSEAEKYGGSYLLTFGAFVRPALEFKEDDALSHDWHFEFARSVL